ncbi:DUF1642 domain-containing protein [Streptococcus gallolyticus subsp. gallolyticus]|uniref:DUF1642 domain-containing protein n=1 Tax=Streptococcus gallolyticus TaxID=315405 RepID=UPI002283C69E|nr:DUF1642 domain-containing protein [Streptococcus gallolyticus]MCY7173656.1 DUF1642 domain-containing protein [Streptococcus gallolyticus subsp. gallolyticus]MCY7175777.1 DUF1642 domain-containing protein [Streptococcus gallolyticus subsp. gallolyticus]MCY7180231.1 DUF1642 domain-containing protein [Streptococcus gallolyticus subsp. gallolyticus]MCY7197783.1 DUF1642 domain-containing protein [Streptococcus gallolyticus subsp. gallolyticus]MCY7204220.1 DUF1642 domain-containing protein [Strep
MNKQEAIEKLQSEAVNHYSETSGWFKEIKLDIVTDIVNQLDEPVKPVIPQYVAEWLEVCKENLALSLANSMDITVMRVHHQHDKTIFWLKSAKNQETFAKAWLYGYEVKKEKLYTAKLKSTGEYLHYDKDYRETRHQRVPDDVAQKCEDYHFTEDELIKYHAWENDAYEIEEVEE